MPYYLLLMHTDVAMQTHPEQWNAYIAKLREGGHFVGGSAIGGGITRKDEIRSPIVSHWIGGYMVVTAVDLAEAERLVDGNPCHACGGTVEVRELPNR